MRSQKDIEAIRDWKDFHDKIATLLGCKYREVNTTIEAAKELIAEIRLLKDQRRELRQRIDEITGDLDRSGDQVVADIRELLNLQNVPVIPVRERKL